MTSYNEQQILVDKNGKPIPQVFDVYTGKLVPLNTSMMGGGGNSYELANATTGEIQPTDGVWFKTVATTMENAVFNDKYILNDLTNLSDKTIVLAKLAQDVLDYIAKNGAGGSVGIDGGFFGYVINGGEFTDTQFYGNLDGGVF